MHVNGRTERTRFPVHRAIFPLFFDVNALDGSLTSDHFAVLVLKRLTLKKTKKKRFFHSTDLRLEFLTAKIQPKTGE